MSSPGLTRGSPWRFSSIAGSSPAMTNQLRGRGLQRSPSQLPRGAERLLLLELRRLRRRRLGLGGKRRQLAIALGGDLLQVGDDAAGAGRDQPPDDDVF